MNPRRSPLVLAFAFAFAFSGAAPRAAETPAKPDLAAEARTALARATAALRSRSTEGGYLWRYSADGTRRAGEVAATPTQVWIQPPGTPSVGLAFLRAHAVTGDARYLDAARAAAEALVRGQLESGGWDYLIEFDPAKRAAWDYRADAAGPAGAAATAAKAPRKNISTFDDDNTQSALRFLLAFADAAKASPDPRDERIRECLDYGLRKFLEAQYPIGAWPQRWEGHPRDPAAFPVKPASVPADYVHEQPKSGYYPHYTLNDNTHRDAVRTLLDAHRRTGRAEYLAAARRGGDFLLLAQLPEPQPVWAQQYNAAMEPAWARAFEPPGVTASESANVVRLLVDLHLELGDEKYLQPLPAAVAWFRRSEISPGRWARLYELRTNRPLYGDRDGRVHYDLAEISEERQHGYGWRGAFGIPEAIAYYEAVKAAGRDAWLATHPLAPGAAAPDRAQAKRLEGRVRRAITALDADGFWLTTGPVSREQKEPGPLIDTLVFIGNAQVLCDYLALAKPAP